MIDFLWRSGKGYRLWPWRSPYLRWRIETYWGWEADRITFLQFFRFLRDHRADLLRFIQWGAEMDRKVRQASDPKRQRQFAVAPDAPDL